MKGATAVILLAAAAGYPEGASAFSVRSQLALKAPSTTALAAATPVGPGDNIFDDVRFGGPTSDPAEFLKRKGMVVIDPDFKLAWMFGFAGLFIWMAYPDTFFNGLGAAIHIWFASFLADRASRCRVVFDDRKKKFEIKNIYKEGSWSYDDTVEGLEERENYVLGGQSGWKYDKFINYDFFPSVDVPILVYFKEDQTDEAKWNVGPGRWDPVGKGQVHFFPAFGNSYQIKREFEKRNLNKRSLQ